MTIGRAAEFCDASGSGSSTGKIVVGVDGSAPSMHALEWALAEAARRQSDCEVVSATEGSARPAGDLSMDEGLADREQSIAELTQTALGRTGVLHVLVRATAIPGRPALVLPLAAAEADLLVVGTRARAAATEAIFGSVAEECLRRSPCPVVVVPPDARISVAFNRVVVGVDTTASSRAALAWAVDESRLRDAELVVLHAWHLPAAPANPYAAVGSAAFRDAGAAILAAAVGELQGDLAHVTTRLVMGTPAASLCDEAERADLVVMGAHGRGRFAGAVVGSVSQGCARHASCPVVVVREGARG